ncbi:hypothetical protein HDU97_003631 [Phlyctochytrium planicorne]|nr:hypothetical protein HDU97_003631 [Phlyctochytrium planicorne]
MPVESGTDSNTTKQTNWTLTSCLPIPEIVWPAEQKEHVDADVIDDNDVGHEQKDEMEIWLAKTFPSPHPITVGMAIICLFTLIFILGESTDGTSQSFLPSLFSLIGGVDASPMAQSDGSLAKPRQQDQQIPQPPIPQLPIQTVIHKPNPSKFILLLSLVLVVLIGIVGGVVVPLLLNLLDRPAWHGSRLPPLLLASTGLDVLIATTCFGVSVAAVFGHKHEVQADPTGDISSAIMHATWLTRGLEEVTLGLGGGTLFGVFGIMLRRFKLAEPGATVILFVITTAGMMYLKTHGFPGAASSSVIVTWAFVANAWDKEAVDVSNKRLKLVWKFAEPFLFPLIGASVSLLEIRLSIIILALLCVSMSILVRMATAYITSWAAGLTPDEQVFTCGLLTGKASVQAALATVTMEAVHRNHLEGTADDLRSKIVFACMVSAILLGAPFAASWVSVFGARAPGTSRGILGVDGGDNTKESKK